MSITPVGPARRPSMDPGGSSTSRAVHVSPRSAVTCTATGAVVGADAQLLAVCGDQTEGRCCGNGTGCQSIPFAEKTNARSGTTTATKPPSIATTCRWDRWKSAIPGSARPAVRLARHDVPVDRTDRTVDRDRVATRVDLDDRGVPNGYQSPCRANRRSPQRSIGSVSRSAEPSTAQRYVPVSPASQSPVVAVTPLDLIAVDRIGEPEVVRTRDDSERGNQSPQPTRPVLVEFRRRHQRRPFPSTNPTPYAPTGKPSTTTASDWTGAGDGCTVWLPLTSRHRPPLTVPTRQLPRAASPYSSRPSSHLSPYRAPLPRCIGRGRRHRSPNYPRNRALPAARARAESNPPSTRPAPPG